LRRKAKIQNDLNKSGFYKKPWIEAMDFKFLKPWRLQLFIRPDIRRNLTDEKKPIHNRHIHMKLRKKNIPETDTQ